MDMLPVFDRIGEAPTAALLGAALMWLGAIATDILLDKRPELVDANPSSRHLRPTGKRRGGQ